MAVSEADMRSAWLHLEESRKANPRLLQVASLPQQTFAGEQSASINLFAQLYMYVFVWNSIYSSTTLTLTF